MDRFRSIGIVAGLAALLVAPSLAQRAPASPPRAAVLSNKQPAPAGNASVPVGSVLKSQNDSAWADRDRCCGLR